MTGKNINLSYLTCPIWWVISRIGDKMVNVRSIRYYCKYKGYPTSQLGFFGV